MPKQASKRQKLAPPVKPAVIYLHSLRPFLSLNTSRVTSHASLQEVDLLSAKLLLQALPYLPWLLYPYTYHFTSHYLHFLCEKLLLQALPYRSELLARRMTKRSCRWFAWESISLSWCKTCGNSFTKLGGSPWPASTTCRKSQVFAANFPET